MQINKFSERIIFLYKSNTIFCWKYKSLVQSPLYNCLEVIPAPFLASPLNISRHPCSWSNQVGMPSCPFPCNNLVQALFCFQTASMIFQWPLIGTFAKTNGLRSCNGRPPSHLCKGGEPKHQRCKKLEILEIYFCYFFLAGANFWAILAILGHFWAIFWC